MVKQLPYVVVVDDDPDEGLLIGRIFSKMDPAVDMCLLSNGEEAVDVLKRPNGREPSVIIMDNKMPHKYGVEVVRELMEYPHMHEVPIVLMSAEFTKREMREAYKAGVRSCVVKGDDSADWNRNLRGILTYWLQINRSVSLAPEDY